MYIFRQTQADSINTGEILTEIHGMIDAHAYHNGANTYPPQLKYVCNPNDGWNEMPTVGELRERNEFPEFYTKKMGDELARLNSMAGYKDFILRRIWLLLAKKKTADERGERLSTEDENELLRFRFLHQEMYRKLSKDEEKKIRELGGRPTMNIPSLVIVSTMDMEFAHHSGYEGIPISVAENSAFQSWRHQIRDTEEAAKANPLRLFPLFSYDPRRYRRPSVQHRQYNSGVFNSVRFPYNYSDGDNFTCEPWDNPFNNIAGYNNSRDINKFWLGFSMNPQLGFRPLDERCPYLPEFYKECQIKQIPIHVHCTPEGFVTHEAALYIEECANRNLGNTVANDCGRTLASTMFAGKEDVAENSELDHFYKNYGHPQNWWQVLDKFPNLRVCLAGFGGNSEWRHESMQTWLGSNFENSPFLPPREWIRSMIILACKYPNVYIDISGLDISNAVIGSGLKWMLESIAHEDRGFGCLKNKLIFGSGWYHSYLSGTIKRVDNVGYNNYCNEVGRFISNIDADLWKRISLINTWIFYRLTTDKIDEICTALNVEAHSNIKAKLIQISRDIFSTTDEDRTREFDENRPRIIFPLLTKPLNDEDRGIFLPEQYCWRAPVRTNQTTYRANRSGGRSHKGRDLYGNADLRYMRAGRIGDNRTLLFRHEREQIAPFEDDPPTTIVAICDGSVEKIRKFYNETWYVIVLHNLPNLCGGIDEFRILYGEVARDSITVVEGQRLIQGQEIAKIGELITSNNRHNYEKSIAFNREFSTQRPKEHDGDIIINMLHFERLISVSRENTSDPLDTLIDGYGNSFSRSSVTTDIGVDCQKKGNLSCINQRHCWHVLSQLS